jgi:hypothetical protein
VMNAILKSLLFTSLILPFLIPSFVAEAKALKAYSIQDLQSLEKQESWNELFRHLKDIAPADRDATWTALAEKSAIAILSDQKDQEGRSYVIEMMQKEFPFLRKSSKINALMAESALEDAEKCFGRKWGTEYCYDDLKRHVSAAKNDQQLALKAANLVQRNMIHWSALEFYVLAINQGPAKAVCQDKRLPDAVRSGLALPDGQGVKDAQSILRSHCWAELKDPVLNELAKNSSSYLWSSTCPIALEKKALSGLKEKKCQKYKK